MPHLESFLAEHAAPKHCCRARAKAQLAPFAAFAADQQKQVVEYRACIDRDTLAEDFDDTSTGNAEHFRQTLGALDRHASALAELIRDIARDHAQLDRYVAEHRATLAKRDSKVPAATDLP